VTYCATVGALNALPPSCDCGYGAFPGLTGMAGLGLSGRSRRQGDLFTSGHPRFRFCAGLDLAPQVKQRVFYGLETLAK